MTVVPQWKQRRGNLLRRKIQYSYQIGQEASTVHASAGGHRFSQGNEKRRAVMAEHVREACGPITHKFRIAKMIEAAVFPRPEE